MRACYAVFLGILSSVLFANETILECSFNQWGHGWTVPSYYSGKAEWGKSGGRTGGMLNVIPAQDKDGKVWGRAVVFPKTKSLAGRIVSLNGYACGKGKFSFGISSEQKEMELTPEWQRFECRLDCTVDYPTSLVPKLEIQGEGELMVDDLKLEYVTDNDVSISAQPTNMKIQCGEPNAEIMFSVGRPNEMLRIYFLDSEGKALSKEKAMADAQGRCPFIPGGRLAPGKYFAVAAAHGVVCQVEYEVLP